jgi:hypothetical protein
MRSHDLLHIKLRLPDREASKTSRTELPRDIRRFGLRGLAKVTSEWKFICATHNLLKLFRHRLALGSHPNHPSALSNAAVALFERR